MEYPTEKRGMNQGQMENQNYSPQQPGYPNQQIPYQQQQYGQPVQMAVQPAIVVNQVSPVVVCMPKLGLSPVSKIKVFNLFNGPQNLLEVVPIYYSYKIESIFIMFLN